MVKLLLEHVNFSQDSEIPSSSAGTSVKIKQENKEEKDASEKKLPPIPISDENLEEKCLEEYNDGNKLVTLLLRLSEKVYHVYFKKIRSL